MNIEEWTANANESVTLSLVGKDENNVDFHPTFTYPIYGNTELIYGYKDLSIDIKLDKTSLLPFVNVKYTEKLPDVERAFIAAKAKETEDDNNVEANIEDEVDNSSSTNDPLSQLLKFMNKEDTIFTSSEDSEEHEGNQLKKWQQSRREPFQVPGIVINSFSIDTKNGPERYSLFKTDLESARLLHSRLRLFVLLFIEAGSYIDVTDDRWELYILYKVNNETSVPEEFVGFTTVYPYFWYSTGVQHDSEPEPNAIRKRISQFVILPPFQGKHLGARLYNALFDQFLEDKNVREVTVEDPSEAFDDLRDRCDLERLYKQGKLWPQLKLPLDPDWVVDMRTENKMAPRQFDRCLEMAFLQLFSAGKPDKRYRLYVKNRLYIRNSEALGDLDKLSQIDKLHETYERLIEDYQRILSKVSFQTDRKGKKRVFEDSN
ncbi:Hat1p [Sugiyamaella lignohabitans]|uniref:Histone acetyltransferase type B catalytic subunit n=1 Tax=Sugiyamaella lignohabitans TaxID=796027 RepID=A0A167FXY8_9ASCO|nr:Hat1p [Sugiyamaella lignohabitans]ANB15844.1 Hat1p [Sugiyamaella lignohabitans]